MPVELKFIYRHDFSLFSYKLLTFQSFWLFIWFSVYIRQYKYTINKCSISFDKNRKYAYHLAKNDNNNNQKQPKDPVEI